MNDQPATIETELHDRVLRIELINIARKNAIDRPTYSEIAGLLIDAEKNPGVGAILLHGRGDTFCSGQDVNDFLTHRGKSEAYVEIREFMAALSNCSVPIVAAVNGPAIGIGATLLLHCDLVYAADEAYLHMPFVSLGLCPEFASSLLLPRRIGFLRASIVLLLGEPIGAQRALEWGLFNTVTPIETLVPEARAAAARIAAQPVEAVRTTKRLIRSRLGAQVDTAIDDEFVEFARLLDSDDFRDAAHAFLDRGPDDPGPQREETEVVGKE